MCLLLHLTLPRWEVWNSYSYKVCFPLSGHQCTQCSQGRLAASSGKMWLKWRSSIGFSIRDNLTLREFPLRKSLQLPATVKRNLTLNSINGFNENHLAFFLLWISYTFCGWEIRGRPSQLWTIRGLGEEGCRKMYITNPKMLAWEPLGQFHIHSHSFLNYLDITFKFRMACYCLLTWLPLTFF